MALQITQEIETTLGVNIPGPYIRLDIKFGLNGFIDVLPLFYSNKEDYVNGKNNINSIIHPTIHSARFVGLSKSEMSLEGVHNLFKSYINTNNSIESTIVDI